MTFVILRVEIVNTWNLIRNRIEICRLNCVILCMKIELILLPARSKLTYEDWNIHILGLELLQNVNEMSSACRGPQRITFTK